MPAAPSGPTISSLHKRVPVASDILRGSILAQIMGHVLYYGEPGSFF
jgi:hypothetical protein